MTSKALRAATINGLRFGSVIAISSMMLAGQAYAKAAPVAAPAAASAEDPQQVAPENNAQVEDIVVTAERRKENIQSTPLSITAFSNESLAARGVQNLQNISSLAPNVELRATTRPAGGSSAYAAFIRGVGTGDYQFPTDPAIGLYVDGVYMARTIGGLLSLTDIERIEVLKGPQGTLFGRNTLGGAMSITTLAPVLSGPATGMAEVRYGSYGRANISGLIRAPLIDGVLGVKLSVASLHFDGYQRQIGGENRFGTENRFVARGAILFEPSDAFSAKLDLDYSRQNQVPVIGTISAEDPTVSANVRNFNRFAAPYLNAGLGLPAGTIFDSRFTSPDHLLTYETDLGYDRNEIGGGALTLSYTVSPALHIKSITAIRGLKSEVRIAGDSSPYYINETVTPARDTQLSEELELSGTLGDNRLNYVGGLFYFREYGHALQQTQLFHGLYESTLGTVNQSGTTNAAFALDTNTWFEQTVHSYAAFAQASFKFTPEFEITGGIRVTKDSKDYSTYVLKPELANGGIGVAGASGVVPLTSTSHDWTSTTPKIGFDYKQDDFMVYANYSEGFKSGAFGSAAATGFIPVIEPEKLRSWEGGFKSQWFDKRLTVNAAVFLNYWDGTQITVISNSPVVNLKTLQNGGNVKVPGYEIQVDAVPVPDLRINLGLGYSRARFTYVTPEAVAGIAPLVLTVGQRFPYTPDWTFDAGAQYTFNLGSAGKFTVRGDYTHKSYMILNLADPSSVQDAYSLFNMRASYRPGFATGLELYVEGRNLGDTRYATYKQTSSSTGESLYAAAEPRMYNVGVSYRF